MKNCLLTPAHHRVHHGVNPQYIDKNFSEFLIIWDKLFGTHEPEKEEVCYGITHPPRTWDPIFINFQYWGQLWRDTKATKSYWDKFRLWFMPLGWRPEDVRDDGIPERIGYGKSEQLKWTSLQPRFIKPYLLAQLALSLIYLAITVNLQNNLAIDHRIALSAGVFMMVIAWGGLLQAREWALPLEIFRCLYMATGFIWALNHLDLSQWYSLSSTVIMLVTGGAIMAIAIIYQRNEKEGQAFPAHLAT